jgi:type I restriction enzyme S subunit
MSEWKTVKLGDICELHYGKGLQSKKRISGNIPVYSSAGIVGFHNEGLVNSHGIIIGRKGTIGTVYYSPKPFFCIDTAYYILPNEKYDLKFLYYRLKHLKLDLLDEDSVIPGLNRNTAYLQEFLFPPLAEQRAIAAALSCLDDKIENNTKINNCLEQMAKAIFKSWFVDFEPWGGKMPADWGEAELGEVSIISAGGDKPDICSPTPTAECSIPIFSNGIDNFGLYGFTNQPRITEESVTVSARGTIGFVCLRQDPFVPIVRLITAVPNNKFVTAKYLYLYLGNIHIAGVGTTQQQLTVPDFKKYRILVPSFKAVKDFTQVVEPMFETMRHKRIENAHLMEMRDALLPRLISGNLRI